MGISTVSFDKMKVINNKVYFTLYGEKQISTRVFDFDGQNLYNKISHNPVKNIKNDMVIISRKNEYEYPNKSIIFEVVERIYNLKGKLLSINKHLERIK